jgi:RHS repeat-associated protein
VHGVASIGVSDCGGSKEGNKFRQRTAALRRVTECHIVHYLSRCAYGRILAFGLLLVLLTFSSNELRAKTLVRATSLSIDKSDEVLTDKIRQARAAGYSLANTTNPPAPEITTLAASLKNDPWLIYEYVYNNIEYEPLFGSNRGSLGTLLDGRGDDIDQAQLLIALLNAAGFYGTYEYGYKNLAGDFASSWLGVKNDAIAIAALLQNGGIPVGNWYVNPDGTLYSIEFAHVWVYALIGGTWYQLDPSLKQHTMLNGLAGLGSAMQFDQSTFLADAGGVITPGSITGINRAAIRNDLVKYSSNLIDYIKAQNPPWTILDVVGGKKIVPLVTSSALQEIAASHLSINQPPGFPTNWGATVPDAYRTCFTISMPGVSATPCWSTSKQTIQLFADETYGHRITISSVSKNGQLVPTLLIDGVPPANGQNTGSPASAGDSWNVNVSIWHPFVCSPPGPITKDCLDFLNNVNQSKTLTVTAGGTYVVAAGWAQVGRGMVEQHRKFLRLALAAPNANPSSEEILGESLSVVAYHWLAQVAASQLLIGQIGQMTILNAHWVGVAGQTGIQASGKRGPYVDLPMNVTIMTQQTCWPQPQCPWPTSSFLADFITAASLESSLESAVLEQTQAPTPNMVAASTIRILDIAAGSNTPIFFADGTSPAGVAAYRNTILPKLSGYSAPDLQTINSAVFDSTGAPAGQQVILPATGNVAVGSWKGAGYTIIKVTSNWISLQEKISGGLSGGFTGTEVPDPQQTQNTEQTVLAPPASPDVSPLVNSQSSPSNPAIKDPVDAVTGTYVYKHVDLVTGGGTFPYSLPFERTYRSSSNGLDAGLGNGWTHNYSFSALSNSDPYQGLGNGSAINAAPAVAAIYVCEYLLQAPFNVRDMAVASIISRWLTDQLTNNAVMISRPDSTEEFVRLPHNDSDTSITYSPPLGSAIALIQAGQSYTYTTKDKMVLSFGSANGGAITDWKYANGVQLNFMYDDSGRLSRVSNNLGRVLLLTYKNGHLQAVIDGTERGAGFQYDKDNNLLTTTDSLANATTYAYDGQSHLTKIFYPANPADPFVTNSYDALGRVSSQLNALGKLSYFYIAGPRSELVDQAGNRHVTYQTADGKIIKDAWLLVNSAGNVYSDTPQINGVLNVTTNQYDGQGRLVQTTLPEGGAIVYGYSKDLQHNVVQTVQIPKPGSPLAPLITQYAYDPIYDRVTSKVDPRGLITKSIYDPQNGNLIAVINDFGASSHSNATTKYSYNSFGQASSMIDPAGTVTQHGYDSFGNRIWTINDYGLNRLNSLTTIYYSAEGDVISVVDPKGNTTHSTYDLARRLSTIVAPATVAAPNGLLTTFTYDPDGRILATNQYSAGVLLRSSSRTYTATGKIAASKDSSGNVKKYLYDAVDRLLSVTDLLGRVTSYGYDAMGRETQLFNPTIQSAPLLQKGYTPDGKMAFLSNGRGYYTNFFYDGFDRLSSTQYMDATTEVFRYDSDDNLIQRKSRRGDFFSLAYDALNRLCTKTLGQQWTPCNGTSVFTPTYWYTYDISGHLTSVRDNGSTLVPATPTSPNVTDRYQTAYTYDNLNRLAQISWSPVPAPDLPLASSGVTFKYVYNKANQVIGQAATDNGWLNYPNAVGHTIVYTSNYLDQYISVGPAAPRYDANGSLAYDGRLNYAYDAESRLTCVSQQPNCSTPIGRYDYDAEGRLKRSSVAGTQEVYVTDADNRQVLEYDGNSGQVQRWFTFALGANEVVGRANVAAGTRETLIPGPQGSVIGIVDSSSGALTKIGYSPFGESNVAPGSFGYTGARFHPDNSGIYYFRARNYSPSWGRFLQPDPVGYAAGSNLYTYLNNDPLNGSDPTGNCPWCVAAGVGAAVGAGTDLAIQLIVNGGQLDQVNWYSVAIAGVVGAGLSGLAPSGWLLGRGGARAAEFGYDQAPGLINQGFERFGWSYSEDLDVEILSKRIGGEHLDISTFLTLTAGANPVTEGAAVGALTGEATRAVIGDSSK